MSLSKEPPHEIMSNGFQERDYQSPVYEDPTNPSGTENEQ
jgi:hypothetical protein